VSLPADAVQQDAHVAFLSAFFRSRSAVVYVTKFALSNESAKRSETTKLFEVQFFLNGQQRLCKRCENKTRARRLLIVLYCFQIIILLRILLEREIIKIQEHTHNVRGKIFELLPYYLYDLLTIFSNTRTHGWIDGTERRPIEGEKRGTANQQ
jgi:DNA-directed RNA polymerase subunit F